MNLNIKKISITLFFTVASCLLCYSQEQDSNNRFAFMNATIHLSDSQQIDNGVMVVKDSFQNVIADARLTRLDLKHATVFKLDNHHIFPPKKFKRKIEKLETDALTRQKIKQHKTVSQLKVNNKAIFWVAKCKKDDKSKCKPTKLFWYNQWIPFKKP